MAGQDFNITGYWEKEPHGKETTYEATNKGLPIKSPAYKAKIIDLEHTSLMNGGAIPDPLTVTNQKRRNIMFTTDLAKMRTKNYMYTGDNWNTDAYLRHRMANRSPDEQSVLW